MASRIAIVGLMLAVMRHGLAQEMKARLVNGRPEAGRLEIFFDGKWNTVCGDGFRNEEAMVACRMLGFNSSGVATVSSARYGAGSGTVVSLSLECVGTETSLAQCQNKPSAADFCGHQWDVGIVCNIDQEMTARLEKGTSGAGRLEIFFNGEWSTVCDRGFDKRDALVACRMLGLNSTGLAILGSARYGAGQGAVLFEDLRCLGTETNLAQCPHGIYYSQSCNHQQDVGLICSTEPWNAALCGSAVNHPCMPGEILTETSCEKRQTIVTLVYDLSSRPICKEVRSVVPWTWGGANLHVREWKRTPATFCSFSVSESTSGSRTASENMSPPFPSHIKTFSRNDASSNSNKTASSSSPTVTRCWRLSRNSIRILSMTTNRV